MQASCREYFIIITHLPEIHLSGRVKGKREARASVLFPILLLQTGLVGLTVSLEHSLRVKVIESPLSQL